MAINNNPLKDIGQSFQQMNKLVKTAAEAVADQVYDADGDKKSLKDVKAEAAKLSAGEQLALAAGTIATGGALPVISLLAEGGIEAVKAAPEAAEKVKAAVEEKYKNPPEKPLIDKAGKEIKKIANKVEEGLDDLVDGRTFRDVNKKGERWLRDNFSKQTPLEKLGHKIGDAAEDAGHAIGDFVDDVKDGRIQRKIKQAFED